MELDLLECMFMHEICNKNILLFFSLDILLLKNYINNYKN